MARAGLPPSPLHAAAERGDLEAARAALAAGADPRARDGQGTSALGLAVAGGHEAVVRLLLDAGVHPDAPAHQDQPALFVAALHGRDALLGPLLEAGAALDYTHPEVGSALCAAVVRGHAHTAERLLSAGIPIALRSESGATALHFAAFTGQRALVERLLGHPELDLDARTFTGGTPLRAAAASGHADVVRLFLSRGADPAPVDDFDRRPVDDARDGGHGEVVAILEAAGPTTRPAPPRLHRCPYAGMLPPRSDATLKAVVQAGSDHPIRSAATALEAPTMLAVIRALHPDWEFSCAIDRDPDPRLPARSVTTQLWSYRRLLGLSADAHPVLPAPPAAVAARVAAVAEIPYHLGAWSRAAAQAARDLDGEATPEVLACMLHPLEGPPHLAPWVWRLRVQVAAALVASHLAAAPPASSAAREALEDVAEGPADWASTAAIIALLDVARRDVDARPAALAALHRCARRRFDPALWQHTVEPALWALHDLAALEPDEQRLLDASLA